MKSQPEERPTNPDPRSAKTALSQPLPGERRQQKDIYDDSIGLGLRAYREGVNLERVQRRGTDTDDIIQVLRFRAAKVFGKKQKHHGENSGKKTSGIRPAFNKEDLEKINELLGTLELQDVVMRIAYIEAGISTEKLPDWDTVKHTLSLDNLKKMLKLNSPFIILVPGDATDKIIQNNPQLFTSHIPAADLQTVEQSNGHGKTRAYLVEGTGEMEQQIMDFRKTPVRTMVERQAGMIQGNGLEVLDNLKVYLCLAIVKAYQGEKIDRHGITVLKEYEKNGSLAKYLAASNEANGNYEFSYIPADLQAEPDDPIIVRPASEIHLPEGLYSTLKTH